MWTVNDVLSRSTPYIKGYRSTQDVIDGPHCTFLHIGTLIRKCRVKFYFDWRIASYFINLDEKSTHNCWTIIGQSGHSGAWAKTRRRNDDIADRMRKLLNTFCFADLYLGNWPLANIKSMFSSSLDVKQAIFFVLHILQLK